MRAGLLFIILVVGCQSEPGAEIVLHAQLPAVLAKDSGRYQRFLNRVQRLHVYVHSKEGVSLRRDFPPGEWENLELSGLDFPKSGSDQLTLHLEIWDRKSDGLPRTYPALVGKKVLKASELNDSGPTEISVKLSLQISASQYDS